MSVDLTDTGIFLLHLVHVVLLVCEECKCKYIAT